MLRKLTTWGSNLYTNKKYILKDSKDEENLENFINELQNFLNFTPQLDEKTRTSLTSTISTLRELQLKSEWFIRMQKLITDNLTKKIEGKTFTNKADETTIEGLIRISFKEAVDYASTFINSNIANEIADDLAKNLSKWLKFNKIELEEPHSSKNLDYFNLDFPEG